MVNCRLAWALGIAFMLILQIASHVLLFQQQTALANSTEQVKEIFAWDSNRDGNFEIYVQELGVGNGERLTFDPAEDFDPSISPDASKIAFASTRDLDGDLEIYVMNLDGSGVTKLTDNTVVDVEPAWSPDGKKIAFTSFRDGNLEIYVMDSNGVREERLTSDLGGDTSPSWSPEGKKIAFDSQRGPNNPTSDIFVMDAVKGDVSPVDRLTSDPHADQNPSWSLDGAKIAFDSQRDGDVEIYIMDSNGNNERRLTVSPGLDVNPVFVPSVSNLYIMAIETDRFSTKSDVIVVNSVGNNEPGPSATVHPGEDENPSWAAVTTPTSDRDGDSLLDIWEINGIDANNDNVIDLDLSKLGSNPNRKDIFVEIDFLIAQDHDHGPQPSTIEEMEKVFREVNVVNNFDGSTGINLHLLLDESIAENANNRELRFNTRGTGLDDDFADLRLGNDGTPTQDPKPCGTGVGVGYFGSPSDRIDPNCPHIISARGKVFHYAIFGHIYGDPGIDPKTSGVGSVGGTNVLVTLGAWDENNVKRYNAEAGTFMHELGHNLNLKHGGPVTAGGDEINCKPNYLSVMNYSYQINHMVDLNWKLDYSRSDFMDLNEIQLNENKPISGPSGRTVIYGNPNNNNDAATAPANGDIDWNGKDGIQSNIPADINFVRTINDCPTSAGQTLKSFEDWQNLDYTVRGLLAFIPDPNFISHPQQDITEQEVVSTAKSVDSDDDGLSNADDNCPFTFNPDQNDADGDGIGDVCKGLPHATVKIWNIASDIGFNPSVSVLDENGLTMQVATQQDHLSVVTAINTSNHPEGEEGLVYWNPATDEFKWYGLPVDGIALGIDLNRKAPILKHQPTGAVFQPGDVWATLHDAGIEPFPSSLYVNFKGTNNFRHYGVSVVISGVLVDQNTGRIYFSSLDGNIHRLDPATNIVQTWFGIGGSPYYLALDSLGNVYSAVGSGGGPGVDQIVRLDLVTSSLTRWNLPFGLESSDLRQTPNGIIVGSNRDIWFSESTSDRFARLDVSTDEICEFLKLQIPRNPQQVSSSGMGETLQLYFTENLPSTIFGNGVTIVTPEAINKGWEPQPICHTAEKTVGGADPSQFVATFTDTTRTPLTTTIIPTIVDVEGEDGTLPSPLPPDYPKTPSGLPIPGILKFPMPVAGPCTNNPAGITGVGLTRGNVDKSIYGSYLDTEISPSCPFPPTVPRNSAVFEITSEVIDGVHMDIFCGKTVEEFANVIVGTANDDTLIGTSGNDLIRGLGGNDEILGRGGHDCLLGGDGDDTIRGGGGRDMIEGEDGNDTIFGNGGNDTVIGGEGNDILEGNLGADSIFGGLGDDRIFGRAGNDAMDGGDGFDTCKGGGGSNTKFNCEV